MMSKKLTFDWEEIEAIAGPPLSHGQPPDTFTIDEFAAKYHLTNSGAVHKLNSLTRENKLERVYFLTPSGRRSNAYRVKK